MAFVTIERKGIGASYIDALQARSELIIGKRRAAIRCAAECSEKRSQMMH
jgi:hypothetical protein